jgi:hypothetical protein
MMRVCLQPTVDYFLTSHLQHPFFFRARARAGNRNRTPIFEYAA